MGERDIRSFDCKLGLTNVQQNGTIVAFIDDMVLEDLVVQCLRPLGSRRHLLCIYRAPLRMPENGMCSTGKSWMRKNNVPVEM